MGAPYDSGTPLSADLTDPAQIEKILALHQAIVDNNSREDRIAGDGYTYARITYTLSGGGELDRRYNSVPVNFPELDTPGTVAYAIKQIMDDRTLVAMAYDFDGLLDGAILTTARLRTVKQDSPYTGEGFTSVHIEGHLQELWEAVRADFDEGTIGLRFPVFLSSEMTEQTYQTSLIFGATDEKVASRPGAESAPAANYELEIYLTPNARHTLAVLDETGVWEEGYSLASWERYGGQKYPDTAAGSGWEIVY